MRKPKFNFLSIVNLLLTVLIIYGCSEDYEIHDHNNNESKIKLKPITINDVLTNTKALEKLTNPKSRFKTNLTSDRIINDTVNNFSVETENGIFIEDGNYNSYTFKITRPNGSNFLLENIVVSKKNETEYETILYQYNITQEELNMIDNGEFVDLTGKINKVFLENSVIASEVTGKYYFNGSCYEDNLVYIPGNTCPQGIHDLSYVLSHIGARNQCIYYLNGTYTATSGTWTLQSTLVPCDDIGGGGTGGTSSYSGVTGGTGGSTTTTPINNCRTCPPEFNPTTTPCQQLKDINNKKIDGFSNPDRKVIDCLSYLNSNKTITKEIGYFLTPTDTLETSFVQNYFTSTIDNNQTGGTIGTNAVSIIMHTHWDIDNQLSIFTIEDIYQIWESLNNTSIMFPDTFTAYLVTAHGTYYAIKISNPQAFINFGNAWFNDWDVDLSVLPSGTTYLSHSEKIKRAFYSKIKSRKITKNGENEKNFAEFLNSYNLGISLYKSSDATFTNWSKVNSDGSTTPCN